MQKLPRIPLHGWLAIDKSPGPTSADIVNKVKWLTRAQKVGHAGTLDPAASGILPIAFGEATKTIPYLVDSRKTYEFTVSFGAATDTDDAEGKIIATSDILPTQEQVEAALPSFVGEIEQTPPAYSAIKVGGERAYDLAREGKEVELKARKVKIYDLQIISSPLAGEHGLPLQAGGGTTTFALPPTESLRSSTPPQGGSYSFSMTCGKGTYVRSVARDLAIKLGTYGHVTQLRRTAVGQFTEGNAILLENLEKMVHSAPPLEDILKALLPCEAALGDIPVMPLDDESARRIRNGNAVRMDAPPGLVSLFFNKKLLAIATSDGATLVPARVFNL